MNFNTIPSAISLNLTSEYDLLSSIKQQPSNMSSVFVDIIKAGITAKQGVNIVYSNRNQTLQEFTKTRLKSEKGLGIGSWQPTKWRNNFKNVEASLITEICQKNLSIKDKTIEIGAGKLEEGLSYLMQRLPHDLRHTIEPTDVNNFYIKESPSLKIVDICEMNQTYPSSSLDKIIGSCVLDTLSDSDLTLACHQIHDSLKPGGLLLHFANLQPFLDTIITSFREDICFPWQDGDRVHGLIRIQKKQLLDFVSTTQRISDLGIKFLRWYANLTISEREITLNEIIISQHETSLKFSNWIRKINLKDAEYINNYVFFENRIRKDLTQTGFDLLKFGCDSRSEIQDRNENKDDNNYFSYEFGKYTATRIYVLAPNKVYYAVKMHIIIAKKR